MAFKAHVQVHCVCAVTRRSQTFNGYSTTETDDEKSIAAANKAAEASARTQAADAGWKSIPVTIKGKQSDGDLNLAPGVKEPEQPKADDKK